ncbi:MAG: aminotransferase class V-fold PLP-dependent enzyme [Planctomycetota bacterium]
MTLLLGVWRHGATYTSVIIAGLFALVIGYDFWTYVATERSIAPIFRNALLPAPPEVYLQVVATTFLLLVAVPLALSTATLCLAAPLPAALTRDNRLARRALILLASACGIAPLLLWKIQYCSGINHSATGGHAYESFYLRLTDLSVAAPASLCASGFSVAVWLAERRDRIWTWARRFSETAQLECLDTAYHPEAGSRRAVIFGGGISPRIRYNAAKERSVIAKLESHGLSSTRAEKCLSSLISSTTSEVLALFEGRGQAPPARVYFFPTTSRALEVALLAAQHKNLIIVSPYEHQSEVAVVRGVERITEHHAVILPFTGAEMQQPHDEQVATIAARIEEIVRKHEEYKHVTLVVSHVCHRSGIIVPWQDIAQAVRSRIKETLRLVVDGAHAVGNIHVGGDPSDTYAYIFCGHKWLSTSEPIGVLVTTRVLVKPPYDAVSSDRLPDSTFSIRALVSLAASLGGYGGMSPSIRVKRTRMLSGFLVELVTHHSSLRLFGPGDCKRSGIVLLGPAGGYAWSKTENDTRQVLERRGVPGTFFALEGGRWLRVTLAYYLTRREVRRVVGVISRLVAPMS